MEHILACRVCLATDVKLYEMCKYRLKTAYENLTGFNMSKSDNLQRVCIYCGNMLNKFKMFREKCARSQQVLEMLIGEHMLITTYHIKSINRHTHNLSIPYVIQQIQNFDTVTMKENFDSPTAVENYSNIIVKNENFIIKSDNNYDDDYDNDFNNDIKINFDSNNDENIENYQNSDGEKNLYDTDEEPLSKKVKKKRKRSKVKLQKPSVKKKFNNIIETDDCLIFPLKQEDQNFPTIYQNLATNDQDLSRIGQDLSTNSQDLSTNGQDLSRIGHDLSTNGQDLSTNDKDLPNQVLDSETNHKLVILSKEEQIEEVMSRKMSANYLNSVHKCDRCFKGFMTEATYKNHMTRHDPCCGPVACPVCGTRWPDARSLRAHTLISHERRYICKICGHTSKSSHKAKEHTQWHAGVTFPCSSCGRSFNKSTSYLTHVRLRHATHVCNVCGQSFIGENGLSMHKKKAHREKELDSSDFHECARCHLQFRSLTALNRHSDINESVCDANLHVCVQCGDQFSNDQLLKQHTDAHLKTDALRTCTQCSRTFANERSLAAHIQRTHARTQTHSPRHCVCEVCGYKCMSASSLVNHQRVHSGEKPHACTHCHKRFSVAQRLQIHVRTHTGERPFQCTRCPKAFKHKAALNRHDRVHTGVKPYSCPQCGKRFSQSNSMKQHCAGVHMKTYLYSRRNKQ